MKQCELCQTNSGQGDFNNLCCRVRWLMKQPNLAARQAWLERWSMLRYYDIDTTKAALAAVFEGRKRK